MRVSPKYIIQLCQREQNQIAQKRSHRYKGKGRRSIACIAGTLLVKGSQRKGQRKGRPSSKDRVVMKPVK